MKYFRKYEYATHRREGRAGAYEAAKPGGERRAETGRGCGEKGRPSEVKRGDTRRFANEVSRRARGDASGRGEGVGQRK